MTERVYVGSKTEMPQLKKMLEYDPYTDTSKELDRNSLEAKIIFVRQEYSIKEGASLGLKGEFYLYINSSDDFLKGADERFAKEFKTIKRAEPVDEKKVIESVKAEKDKAAEGFGSIFG